MMEELTLKEAQLFRLLCGLFTRDNVIPLMSVMAVCGGELPSNDLKLRIRESKLQQWAKTSKCLFTIVDNQDDPKLVVEFFDGFEDAVDAREEEHQRLLRPLLKASNIQYITISRVEFAQMLNSPEENGFCELMSAKLHELENEELAA